MNRGITLDIEGVETVQGRLKDITQNIKEVVEDELEAFGVRTVAQAKDLAPVDEGNLRNAISYKKTGLEVEIIVAANYAAYVEFGTRKFAAKTVALLPQEWQEFAEKFRGPGNGTLTEFLDRLAEWVLRKGFAAELTKSGNRSKSKSSLKAQQDAAYAIAIQILLNGIKAHPFLYPSVRDNKKILIDNLKMLLDA